MTVIKDIDPTCPVCGKQSSQNVLMSTNTVGYADLDFRPSSMKRETMPVWLMECPECGYVAWNLNHASEFPRDFLKSDEYKSCEGYVFKEHLSEKFYRRYMIERELNNTKGCLTNLLRCAWACDDSEDENAIEIRKTALSYIDDNISRNTNDEIYLLMVKADLLRRTGQFDKLINEFSDVVIGEDKYDAVLQFQLARARQKDPACYSIGHALAKFGDVKEKPIDIYANVNVDDDLLNQYSDLEKKQIEDKIISAIRVFVEGGMTSDNTYCPGLSAGEHFFSNNLSEFLDNEIPELNDVDFIDPSLVIIENDEKVVINSIDIDMLHMNV